MGHEVTACHYRQVGRTEIGNVYYVFEIESVGLVMGTLSLSVERSRTRCDSVMLVHDWYKAGYQWRQTHN